MLYAYVSHHMHTRTLTHFMNSLICLWYDGKMVCANQFDAVVIHTRPHTRTLARTTVHIRRTSKPFYRFGSKIKQIAKYNCSIAQLLFVDADVAVAVLCVGFVLLLVRERFY